MSAKNGSDFAIGGGLWAGTSKLLEEMGELQQVLGKLLGTGGTIEHWDGTNLRERLVEELGDLNAAIAFFVETNMTYAEAQRIEKRMAKKIARFEAWHTGGKDPGML